MPLWMQGALELLITAAISYAAVIVLFMAVWFAGGVDDANILGIAQYSGIMWLLIHGVPLELSIPEHGTFAAVNGTLSLIPLGLTLIPLALCFRSGRRLAQASYEGQFWVPTLAGTLIYCATSLCLSLFFAPEEISTHPVAAAVIPAWVVLLGVVGGGWYESRSLARMIGVNAAEWVSRFSQYSRWAGSYVWAVLCSSVVAVLGFIALGGLLFAATVLYNWNDVVTVYQMLNAGAIGDTAVTLLQLGVIPNFVVWAMAWSAGAGFAIGQGTAVNLFETNVGPMPALPVLGALPHPVEPLSYAAVAVPILAGVCAGWWFFCAGENHFDEWLSLKIRFRWISSVLSTVALGVFIAVPAGIITGLVGWFASGSLGLGRFTELGPDPLLFGALAAVWIAAGMVLGSILAPLVEPDNSVELERFADETRAARRQRKKQAKANKKAAAQQAKRERKLKKKSSTPNPDNDSADEVFEVDDEPENEHHRSGSRADHLVAVERIFATDEEEEHPQTGGTVIPLPRQKSPSDDVEPAFDIEDTGGGSEPQAPQNDAPLLTQGRVIRRPQAKKNRKK